MATVSNISEYRLDPLSPIEREWLEEYIKENLKDVVTIVDDGDYKPFLSFSGDTTKTKLVAFSKALEKNLGTRSLMEVILGTEGIRIQGSEVKTSPVKSVKVPTGVWE